MRLAWGLLVLVFALSACTLEPSESQYRTPTPRTSQTGPEAERIRKTFDALVEAVNSKDSAAALPLFSRNSFELYDTLRKHALTSTEDQVSKLPMVQRTTIYGMRGMNNNELLRHGTPQELVDLQVREGIFAFSYKKVGGPTESFTIKPQLEDLDIQKDRATAVVTNARIFFVFLLEDGEWKVDLGVWRTSWGSKALEEASKKGVTEEQYITQVFVQAFGEARAAELRLPVDR